MCSYFLGISIKCEYYTVDYNLNARERQPHLNNAGVSMLLTCHTITNGSWTRRTGLCSSVNVVCVCACLYVCVSIFMVILKKNIISNDQ